MRNHVNFFKILVARNGQNRSSGCKEMHSEPLMMNSGHGYLVKELKILQGREK
jgi:hypothetical protein